MSLKWKMSLLTAGLLLAAVAAFSAVLLWTERRSLEEERDRLQREAAAALAEVCRSAIVNQQDLPLTNSLKRLAAADGVVEAFCVDESGRFVGHTDPTLLQSVRKDAPSAGRPLARVSAPVTVGARRLGSVEIAYDRSALERRLDAAQEASRRRVLQVFLAVGGAGFVLAFAATALAVRPVRTLVEGVRTLAAGRLDHQIDLRRRDELGWLADEFNRMAGRLSELDRMKADFVNGVTHDLKSPLTSVKASTDNLRAQLAGAPGSAPALESVDLIRRNTDRLMDLITSILEVARIEDGLTLNKTPVDLETLADRVVRAHRPQAERKGVALELVAERPVPPFPADEGKLERAISNLVGNAVKFTEKGSVTVTVDREGTAAKVGVRDTGPGVPAAFRERLFTKFSRAESAGRKVEGTGLGLSIVKGIAEAHGGSVEAASPPGGGALFILRIPIP